MRKIKATIRPQHHSQYIIEGGELFALEGIALGIVGGWWLCHQFNWHWLIGALAGGGILASFMRLLSITFTRLVLFGLNAIATGLLSYLLATALFGLSERTAGLIGVMVAVTIFVILVRRFELFRHDLTMFRQLKEEHNNQQGK